MQNTVTVNSRKQRSQVPRRFVVLLFFGLFSICFSEDSTSRVLIGREGEGGRGFLRHIDFYFIPVASLRCGVRDA